MNIKTTLKRLSICDCGFLVLNDEITLGTEYYINPDKKDSFLFVCGGCRKTHHVTGVWVEPRIEGGRPGYLPEDIFHERR